MLTDKLEELENRVRLVVALMAKLKEEKLGLKRQVEELRVVIKGQAEQMGVLEAARKKDREQLDRMAEEREEIRLKIDRLLEEVVRIETAVESSEIGRAS